jgi:hypothetical protein
VAKQVGAPPRAWLVALATAKQESDLRNINYGDRDSLGLFQQRPSQGWGSPAQVLDPVYSTSTFLDRLLKVPNWQRLPVTVAAQTVQRSAFPDAYAKWEGLAAQLVQQLADQRGSAAARAARRVGVRRCEALAKQDGGDLLGHCSDFQRARGDPFSGVANCEKRLQCASRGLIRSLSSALSPEERPSPSLPVRSPAPVASDAIPAATR